MAIAKRRKEAASPSIPGRSWAELPVWLLVVLVPIVVHPSGSDVFRDVKLHTAQILALSSIALLLWERRRVDRAWPWKQVAALPTVRISLLILVAAGLSLLTTRDWDYSVVAFFELAVAVACLVAWSLAWDSSRLRAWLLGLIAMACILAAIGILQFYDIWEPFDFLTRARSERVEITSLAGASGDLAAFLVLPILMVQALMQRRKKWRWRLLPVALILVYALVLTQSFTALIAAGLGSALFWMISLPRRVVWIRGGALLSILLIVVLAFAPLRSRVSRVARSLSSGDMNSALTGRLDAWKAAKAMWSEHPALGVGHGAFRSEFGATKLDLAKEGDEFFGKHAYANFSFTHNEFLQVLAEWGLVGFLAFLAAIFILLRESIKLSRTSKREMTDRSLALSGLMAIVLLSVTYFPWHLALTAYPFLLFVSWILALRQEQEASAE